MKSLKFLILIIVTAISIVGYSMRDLSEEAAMNVALEFAKTYALENHLDISQNELMIVRTDRVDKLDTWVIYIDYPRERDHDKIKLPTPAWIAVSDNEEIVGYNFLSWGGEWQE